MKHFLVFILLAVASCTESHIIKKEKEHESSIVEANDVRIQGGVAAGITKFPYMISVRSTSGIRGAAVIINKNWGLTAGIIFHNYINGTLTFRTGSSQQNKGKVLKVGKYFDHPKYGGGWTDDLTIFKFTKPLTISNTIRPISIAFSLPANGTMVTVSGWGDEEWVKESGTTQLGAVKVKYTDTKTCQPLYYQDDIDDGNFCTLTPDKSPCAFDWGAPVVHEKALIGIYVGGEDCGSLTKPPLYLDLTRYRKWVLDTIKRN
uniref:Trypsin-23 n=1 Tax=Nilaparvata lugens TaxID=108931 RepID=A0A068F699_NILLU|nr:trypsin-23 [Nilaparvata lugens]